MPRQTAFRETGLDRHCENHNILTNSSDFNQLNITNTVPSPQNGRAVDLITKWKTYIEDLNRVSRADQITD